MFSKCKITVIKRKIDKELINEYLKTPGRISLCDKVNDGQEFIINNPFEMPDGICAAAWAATGSGFSRARYRTLP